MISVAVGRGNEARRGNRMKVMQTVIKGQQSERLIFCRELYGRISCGLRAF